MIVYKEVLSKVKFSDINSDDILFVAHRLGGGQVYYNDYTIILKDGRCFVTKSNKLIDICFKTSFVKHKQLFELNIINTDLNNDVTLDYVGKVDLSEMPKCKLKVSERTCFHGCDAIEHYVFMKHNGIFVSIYTEGVSPQITTNFTEYFCNLKLTSTATVMNSIPGEDDPHNYIGCVENEQRFHTIVNSMSNGRHIRFTMHPTSIDATKNEIKEFVSLHEIRNVSLKDYLVITNHKNYPFVAEYINLGNKKKALWGSYKIENGKVTPFNDEDEGLYNASQKYSRIKEWIATEDTEHYHKGDICLALFE